MNGAFSQLVARYEYAARRPENIFVLVPTDAKYEHGSNVRTNNQFSSLGEQETTKGADSGFPRHAI